MRRTTRKTIKPGPREIATLEVHLNARRDFLMQLPYAEPLTIRELAAPVVPEPPRRGEPGGEPCGICGGAAASAVWSNDLWSVHPPVGGSLPGTVWLASREHADSFSDLSDAAAADFGRITARVETAILGLGGFARVHLYRWGDGGAHFHVWFIPRPLGMLDAQGMMLPLWEDVLPTKPDEELRAAAEKVAAALGEVGL
jgi:diadenosine tetraphosphate (Ap4A) HIT family hydrolase